MEDLPRTTRPSTDGNTNPSVEPAIIVIFGITGDLASRYLLPALYRLFRDNLLDDRTEIVGISRRDLDLEHLFDGLERTIADAENTSNHSVIERLRRHTHGFKLDMDDPGGYDELLRLLNDIESQNGVCMNRLYYLSIPPAAYGNVIRHMGSAGLNESCQHGKAMTRLLVEKPFGHDLASAQELIDTTAVSFGEEQVFRIDHYLAKETAQNIVVFRFENPLFETVWNKEHVASIDIVASEKIGIEGRADFYEGQGALRDFIQNHLLQLLAIATMDKPDSFDSESVHEAKLRLLQSVAPITADKVQAQARRGQYVGYKDETGNLQSNVETFAAITTTIDSPRWAGVPLTVRTGKNTADKRTTVTFTFADRDGAAPILPNQNILQFRIQPNEGISLKLLAKKPGFGQELQPVAMDFSYAGNFDGPHPDAYERVILDSVRGDRTLFASSQEVLASWRIIDAVVHAWQESGDGLRSYEPGTPIDAL